MDTQRSYKGAGEAGSLSLLRPCSRGRGGVWICSFHSPALALAPPPPQYKHLRQEPRPWPAKIKAPSSRAVFAFSPDFSEKDYGTIFLKYHRPCCTVLHDSPVPRRSHNACLVSPRDPSYSAMPLQMLPPQLPDTGMPLPSTPNTIPGRKGLTKIQSPIKQISMQKLISTPQNHHYQRLHTCSSEGERSPSLRLSPTASPREHITHEVPPALYPEGPKEGRKGTVRPKVEKQERYDAQEKEWFACER